MTIMEQLEGSKSNPWVTHDGRLDANWSPLVDQTGSNWVIKMEPFGVQHVRLDTYWSPVGDQNGFIWVIKIEPSSDQNGSIWVIKMKPLINMAAWIHTGAPWVTQSINLGNQNG
mgnify:CR=1 FL=1